MKKKTLFCLAMTLMTLWTATAWAQDVRVPVQGLVTDREGVPLEGDVTIEFKLYADANGGEALWSATQTLRVARGTFSTLLGKETALDAALFEANPGVTLTLKIGDDDESARVPLGWTPMSASAERAKVAADAQTLQGLTPDDLRDLPASAISYEDADAELGAGDTQAALQAVLTRLKTLEAANAALEARLGQVESSTVSPMTIQALEMRVAANETAVQDAATERQNAATDRMALSGRIDMVVSDLGTTSTTVANHTARLGALETSQSTQDQALASFQMTTNGRLNQLDADVITLGQDVMSAQMTASSAASTASNASSTATALSGRVTTAEQDIAVLEASDMSQASTLNAYDGRLDALEAGSTTALDARITTLEGKTASMSVATINSQPAVVFEDVNLHVRSGLGTTNGVVNGRGNLIIGYDEARGSGSDKTGSHNLVLGRQANYSSYGGIIGGDSNATSGAYSMALTGTSNEATQSESIVLSGRFNDAIAQRAVVIAGNFNEASNTNAVAISGTSNRATGLESVTISGSTNVAGGTTAVIVSGFDNLVDSFRSVVVGGWVNEMTGSGTNYSVIGGGDGLTITGSGNERRFFSGP